MALHELNPIDPKRYSDILALLRSELNILEQQGHGRSAGGAWKSTSILLDSAACPNINSVWWHLCADCLLTYFVPLEHRWGPVPCHLIPLNMAGETIKSIRQTGNQEELKEAVRSWLRATIERLEEMTTGQTSVPKATGPSATQAGS